MAENAYYVHPSSSLLGTMPGQAVFHQGTLGILASQSDWLSFNGWINFDIAFGATWFKYRFRLAVKL
jgi:hypothetical protein